jgi:hypothetical protein
MPERRRFTQTTSLEESLAKEALLVRKARRAETASHMTKWPASGYRHQDKFN